MAASTPQDMDGFLPLLTTMDTKAKLTIGAKLQTYLSEVLPNSGDGEPSIQCSDIGLFIDSLLPWITSSNYKVSLQGLEIMIELCDKMKQDFRPFVPAILPVIIDRLGDSKHGSSVLVISRLVPHIVKLLSDPHGTVRDSAFNSLVVIYKFVGDRLKLDLTKKYQVPANKLAPLLSKFEDIKLSGELHPSAVMGESLFNDEVDRATNVNSLKRSTLESLNSRSRNIPKPR
uniref:CLIP-associating protein n=1 Tax=Cacopsylla melanoneura TaxID=428564 RepID=A0A8D8PVB3_9HEMI